MAASPPLGLTLCLVLHSYHPNLCTLFWTGQAWRGIVPLFCLCALNLPHIHSHPYTCPRTFTWLCTVRVGTAISLQGSSTGSSDWKPFMGSM